MSRYLILILPAVVAALWRQQWRPPLLLAVWAFMTAGIVKLVPEGSRDFFTYVSDFDFIASLPLGEVPLQDPLYLLSIWALGRIGVSAYVFLLALASAALLLKLFALSRLTEGSSVVVVLYVTSYFFIHEFTQIRAALAIGIWMFAVIELDRSRTRAILLTLLASLIHVQAVLGLVVIGLQAICRTRRSTLIVSAVAVGIVILSPTRLFDQAGYALLAQVPDPRTVVYMAMAEGDIWVRPNPFSFMSLLALGTGATGLVLQAAEEVPSSPHNASRQAVFLSLLIGSAALGALAAVPVAAFRVAEHFLALLPVGLWILWKRHGFQRRHQVLLWCIAAVQTYIFLFYSAYLLEP
jgi:hypothetical protein